ncbi:mechanosensitive ion channel domain-containing protein [uncultured Alistipes sp.]|jgi:small-conductance mechanosensitive channel|uniref:mechanosensitive ion channel family protein n=1 Tax=uncultured Alistipes sp. TaxID=538949 RepID=UPI0025E0D85B|nr:mechanosensitive ion channel domain-containing protein [uncultured Alistipes sp.]
MHTILKNWADALLEWLGFSAELNNGWDRWVAFLLVVLAVALFDFLARVVLVRSMRKVIRRINSIWANQIFSSAVLNRTCNVISAFLLMIILPLVFDEQSGARLIVLRLVQIYTIVTIFRLINALLYAVFNIIASRPAWHNKPIKGLRQTGQGIAGLICVIWIISILVNESPAILLTGLGASAAITALIFRDSILGFISGIQLSANDMLQVGDWISVPKYDVNGSVEEVNLTTVKVRNRDNTIVTIPPYLLVSESFQNLRPMQQMGGRRVMRSVNIDMTSVKFCTAEMLAKYRKIDLIRDYIDQVERDNSEYNAERGVKPGGLKINGRHQTNLGVFRAYLEHFLRSEVPVHKEMALAVRQLQPTETGMPIELYFFTDTVVWVEYEKIQSDVFDHVLAVVPEFDLRVFQNPSGSDIGALYTPQKKSTGKSSELPG